MSKPIKSTCSFEPEQFFLDNVSVNGNLSATLSTAAQPNITSLGSLTGLNVSGTVQLQNEVNFTTGQAVRLRGINYVSLARNSSNTTDDTYGLTPTGIKFNHADSILYKTGFGFQGYDDFGDGGYSISNRNAYIAGDDGINLFVNGALKTRLTSSSTTLFQDLNLSSSDLNVVNIAATGTLSVAGESTFDDLVKAHSGLAVNDGVDGTSNQGIYMWHPLDPEYSIYLAASGSGKSITDGVAVAGHDFNGHSIRFREKADATTTSTGFIFENSNEELLMSINATNKSAYVAGKLGVGASPLNKLDVSGNLAIGSTLAGSFSAPTNGLRVQGEAHFNSLIKLQSYMASELNTMSPENGHLAYNSTTNKFVGYANGAWVDLH